MDTHSYRLGSPGPFTIRLIDGAQIPIYDATAAQLRIQARDACVVVPGVLVPGTPGPLVDPLYGFDLNSLDLPPRSFRTEMFYSIDDGAGMRPGFTFALHIQGGC